MKAAAFGLCFLVAGVMLLVSGARGTRMTREARQWPTVDGTILTSRCTDYSDWDNGARYLAEVTYEYAVGERSYRGDRIAFGYDGGGWRAPNERIAKRLVVAKPVQVRYDPRNPAVAVLSVGVHGANVRTLSAGFWLLLVAWLLFRFAAKPPLEPSVLSVRWRGGRPSITSRGFGDVALVALVGWVATTVVSAMLDWGIVTAVVAR